MARDVGICFRTTDEVKQALEAIAVIERRTLSSFIENVLRDHIKGRVQLKDPGQERRRHFRKVVLLPALVYKRGSNGSAGMAGTVVDLSLVGLKIYIPHNCDIGQGEEFDTIFAVPNEKAPVTIRCVTRRVVECDGDARELGADFVNAHLADYQKLMRIC